MKKYMMRILIFTALLFFTVTCNDDDPVVQPIVNPAPVINIVKSGTWRITLFEDSGTNETANFIGYNFAFGSSSVLTASNDTNVYIGFWSVTSDNSGDDSPSNDLDFNIAFVSPPNFEELTEDWNILEFTSTKIKLVHLSGGGGGIDYLTFEKN